ncbi:MAG: aminoacyl-tRNA hydrolase [Candidatus Krumholzibacteriota bacterium]|nr:aminoacyl-tRNA hydrolase [Candidatus Krumholzibacteriota bacterium]
MVWINDKLEIPDDEIHFSFARSSKPGGQNVNKVNTKVLLTFDILSSSALDPDQISLIRQRLSGRINKAGVLRVSSQKHRTQMANRQAALERFIELVREALIPELERKRPGLPRSIKEYRLREKKKRGELKKNRTRPQPVDFD